MNGIKQEIIKIILMMNNINNMNQINPILIMEVIMVAILQP